MKRTVPKLQGPARSVARGELIGLPVKVIASTDSGLVGFSGMVVDETLRTVTVRRGAGAAKVDSRISKVGNTFEFTTANGPVQVVGAAIEFRPDERTKKVR